MNQFKRAAGAAILSGLLICAGAAQASPPPAGSTYVAMGSSYAAGTALPRRADDSPERCNQGVDNYPRQVARALNLKLVDRSCGGAVTRDVLEAGQFGLPAQLDGVTADTRLVTVTIGGNDVRFTADFGLFSCRHRNVATCATPAAFEEEAAFAKLEPNLREIAARIRARAPQAKIVFVDYATLLPANGTCADLGVNEAEAAALRTRAARLATLTAKVAADSGAELVAASAVTRGHNVCAADPWVAGELFGSDPATRQAAPFHPRLSGTTAIASAIVERLRK